MQQAQSAPEFGNGSLPAAKFLVRFPDVADFSTAIVIGVKPGDSGAASPESGKAIFFGQSLNFSVK